MYSLGKESLLVELAMEFRTWIEVSVERMQTLKVLQLADVFTTDPGAGRIRVVDQSEVRPGALEQWNREQPTLAILPTSRPLLLNHSDIYVVPYSDHSSYKELEDFVSALKPTTVLPIVGNYIPGSLSALVPRRKRHEFPVPESVRQYMCRQPKSHVAASASNNLQRRHFHPLGPRGVIFESPARGSGRSCDDAWAEECLEQNDVEEEADTDSSDKDSDCLVIDLSVDLTPESHGRGSADTWSVNIETMCEDELAPRSLDAAVHLQLETDTSQQIAPGHPVTEGSGARQRSGGINQGQDVAIDSASQHIGHQQNERALRSMRHIASASFSFLTVLRQEYVERIENSVLAELSFSD